jgi:hypothetical protein
VAPVSAISIVHSPFGARKNSCDVAICLPFFCFGQVLIGARRSAVRQALDQISVFHYDEMPGLPVACGGSQARSLEDHIELCGLNGFTRELPDTPPSFD